jgi:chitinase
VRLATLTGLAAVALLGAFGAGQSGADFAAGSSSPANSFTAAADFNTVAVAMTDPGTPLSGTVALQATASSDRGIASVRFQSSPAGAGAWTDACTATAAPYTCDWDSGAGADGAHDLRASATDTAGYQRSSAVVPGAVVDNTDPAPALADPGFLQGTETLSATASDGGSGVAALAIAYHPAGGGSWTTLCSGAGSPQSCPLATGGLPDGAYELRARATDGAGNTGDSILTRTVDNTAPTVSVVTPPVVRGTITVAFAAGDGAGTGVTQVRGEMRPSGGGAWTPLCTDTVAPFECANLDTTQVPDGLYDARAIADDGAGFSTTSSVVVVRVDNAPPAVPTLNNPGVNLQGLVALSGTASDAGSGIAAWVLQHRPAGGGSWTDACSDAAAPYGCSWDTTGVADALYDLRAVARDQAGNETPSAMLANRRVDNNGPVVTLADPGAYLRGTVSLSATATDPAGVQSVVFERKLTSGGGWTVICTDNAAPYTCSFNTTGVANGTYDLRARATDTLAHVSTATVGGRVIDNTRPVAAAVDSGNGGATPGRLEAGDWLRLTWSEPIAPVSVLSGWDGSPVAVRVQLRDSGGADELNVWNAAGTTLLGLIDPAANVKLNQNYVTTNAWFDATLTRSGAAFTITLGAQLSGTLTTATGPANIRWWPAGIATDLAGNLSLTTSVREPNPSDMDF